MLGDFTATPYPDGWAVVPNRSDHVVAAVRCVARARRRAQVLTGAVDDAIAPVSAPIPKLSARAQASGAAEYTSDKARAAAQERSVERFGGYFTSSWSSGAHS